MDPIDNPRMDVETQEVASSPRTLGLTSINRRDWMRMAVGGGVGLVVADLFDLSTVRAATKKLKLANVTEFTTSCNFCSCGCGMIASVREGISLKGPMPQIAPESYSPSIVEWGISIGLIAATIFLFGLGARLMPVLPKEQIGQGD